jgi:hypothetical protein
VVHHTVGSAPIVKGVFGDFDRNAPEQNRQHLDSRANIAQSTGAEHPAHPDDLFRDIDGRQIARASGVWLVFVSAIHAIDSRRWIQVALSGTPSYSVVLNASERVGGTQALEAIAAWLSNPIRTDRIIAVD